MTKSIVTIGFTGTVAAYFFGLIAAYLRNRWGGVEIVHL